MGDEEDLVDVHEYERDEDETAGLEIAPDDGAPTVSKRDMEKQLAAEARETKQRREAKLKALREEQVSRAEAATSASADNRLAFLMQQAELFTHFVHGGAGGGGGGGGGGGSGEGAGGGGGGASSSSSSSAAGGGAARSKRAKKDAADENLGAWAPAATRPCARARPRCTFCAALSLTPPHSSPCPPLPPSPPPPTDDFQVGAKVTKQPGLLVGEMRDYQVEGLNWMVNLHDNNISGILADEMGLGKTIQSISLLAFLKEYRGVKGPHMVLAPKSVLGNWMKELKKFCPALKCLLVAGDKEERTRIVKEELLSGEYEVVVASYETLCIERAAFRKFAWYYIVIDEAHRIKNDKSLLSVQVRAMASQYRLLLTGTPLQNNLHELWALLNFLMPDVFSSSEDFDGWFSKGGAGGGDSGDTIRKLHAVIKPFMLRRKKADRLTSLLPKIEVKLHVPMTELQKTWYRTVLLKDVAALNAIGGAEKTRLLNVLMQLRKVCNHPYLFDGAEPPGSGDGPHLWEAAGKMVLLDKLLPKLQAQGSRALIFCQMTRVLDILEDYVRIKGYGYCRIDGNTSGVDREAAMDAFNAPDSSKFLFLLSTRAGGMGINLYTADTVILYDSDWNPQADLQAMDRAHRIGQKKQVRVFRLVTEKSVEEKIVERAERKLYLDALVIQQGRLSQTDKGLSKGELMSMVKYGADEVFKTTEGSPLTDADIDVLLAQGEERTKAASEKLKRDMGKVLGASVSLEDLLKTDTSKYLYDDGGEGGGIGGGGGGAGLIVQLPEREKKTSGCVLGGQGGRGGGRSSRSARSHSLILTPSLPPPLQLQ